MDYGDASRVFHWLVEPSSHRARSWRAVALCLTLNGPQAFGCKTVGEVAAHEGMSERTLRALRNLLRVEFGIVPPAHVFAGDSEPVAFRNHTSDEPFAEIIGDDEGEISAGLPL
ncbi:MAG: hypothetical protein H3C27_01130 [Opitutaceae bacterium]|nr:hypothetical protein [Opitutaceae bacterium]